MWSGRTTLSRTLTIDALACVAALVLLCALAGGVVLGMLWLPFRAGIALGEAVLAVLGLAVLSALLGL